MAVTKVDNLRQISIPEANEWTPAYIARAVIVKKLGEVFNSDSPFWELIPKPLREKPPTVFAGSVLQVERFPALYVSVSGYEDMQFLSGGRYFIGRDFSSIDTLQMSLVPALVVGFAESLDLRDMLISTALLAFKTYFIGYYEVISSGATYVVGFDKIVNSPDMKVDETIGNYPIYYGSFTVQVVVSASSVMQGYDQIYRVEYSAD